MRVTLSSAGNPDHGQHYGENLLSPTLRVEVKDLAEVQRTAQHPHSAEVVSFLLPSPLSVLCDALVVPEEPASRAFALAACRRLLFLRMKA
jgi:hypothetical protein